MDQAKQQIIDSIKSHNNVLVTVSTNPSVDELSAALGLTVMLNNLDKRATSVFSGAVPPAINFLEPEKTFENSAESLRDFIIALDKEKADHLRYKVDGDLVKIFITPYRTTLSQGDLEFSQGDYNVDLVVALGVKDQNHLDKALEAHGKILHDATVITITNGADPSSLGSLDWHDATTSSLCEMIASLADGLKEDQPLLDQQTSTALLTGIVSATDRFSNDHTSSLVMTIAAQLMAAGANQQLIAAKLEETHNIGPHKIQDSTSKDADKENDQDSATELTIERPNRKANASKKSEETNETPVADPQPEQPQDETAQTQETKETKDQAELEQQLAGLTTSPAGTVEDIEKELQQAVGLQPEPAQELSPAPADVAMPGFEPTGTPPAPSEQTSQLASEPTPQPAFEPPQPLNAPQIINERGSVSTVPPGLTPPTNGIQDGSKGDDTIISPFDTPPNLPDAPLATPAANGGTPEGAALLAATEATDSSNTAPPAEQVSPFNVPELPPLPPLPTEMDMPLPPPPPSPPPPSIDPPSLDNPMPSGAISGDVFGDASTGTSEPPSTENPPEPGQFKIPGQ